MRMQVGIRMRVRMRMRMILKKWKFEEKKWFIISKKIRKKKMRR